MRSVGAILLSHLKMTNNNNDDAYDFKLFDQLAEECKKLDITIEHDRKCGYFYNCGDITALERLKGDLAERGLNQTISIAYFDGNLHYTSKDPGYTDTIIGASVITD
jgi:hypothetical protein